MFVLFIFVAYIGINIIYYIDEETSKNLVSVKDNNISIYNPNIYVLDSLAKTIGDIGTGGTVIGGMYSVANLTKLGGMPIGAKIIVVATGGTIARSIFIATNAMNTIVQRGLENSKNSDSNLSNNNSSDNNGSYTTSSIINSGDDNSNIIDTVIDLLYSNLAYAYAYAYVYVYSK
jgi:hypothetical protein